MSNDLFCKWRGWLDRIRKEQLFDLLINQHIFKQLGQCTAAYVGTHQGAKLAEWMKQGYIAFSGTTVRRMLEKPPEPAKAIFCNNCGNQINKRTQKPNESISLVILMQDIKEHASVITREMFKERFKKDPLGTIADREFNKITRSKTAKVLLPEIVDSDIKELEEVAKPVRNLVNKVIAHTERDCSKVGKLNFKQLNDAIDALANAYKRYSILVRGSYPNPLVPLDNFDVLDDLKKIWPERKSGS
ncbi:MAG: hypothetical protein IT426_11345 [Pirellulales bacterium]|nr:hypothetical protein [Pirellulales bacterium]